jgi:hypothetical protein
MGYRSGYYVRSLATRVGKLELRSIRQWRDQSGGLRATTLRVELPARRSGMVGGSPAQQTKLVPPTYE